MKQTIFEIRKQTEELLQNAISIWQQSDQSEYLEGIEKDPAFSLLLTALAYQQNDVDNDIERFKEDIQEEFFQSVIPYGIGHAQPATAVISTMPQEKVPEVKLTDKSSFFLNESSYSFIPLLKTRVLGCKIAAVTRLDNRRWKVSLRFNAPVTDLSYFSFAITHPGFKDLKVSIGGHQLPLTKPWNYSDLPLSDSFALDTMIYNQQQTFNASNAWMDLFAKQNVRIFCIKKHNPHKFILFDTDSLDCIFEFSGLSDSFSFDKTTLLPNCTVLVNAKLQSTHISSSAPIVRVAGYGMKENKEDQFMHLVRPSEEQLYGNVGIGVRHVAADRFTPDSLIKLLDCLIQKFDTDYYAFLELKEHYKDNVIQNLRDNLSKLKKAYTDNNFSGVYLMLKQNELTYKKNISLKAYYLTTSGASVNSFLNERSKFSVPPELDFNATQQIAAPVPGSDETTEKDRLRSLSHYYMITNDRLVTAADIKIFCYNQLMLRYGIVSEMIEDITIQHRQQIDKSHCGYEISVEIAIADNPFVKRHFVSNMPQAELLLQKMIEVRSANIYPIQVSIRLSDSDNV